MPTRRKRDEIGLRIGLGDDVIVMLRDLDDPESAKILTEYIWEGIDEDGER